MAGMESVMAAAIAMLALGATPDAPAATRGVQLAQSAPAARPAPPPPGSPAAPTAVEQAVKEAFAGVVVHEDGSVETTGNGQNSLGEDGLPQGLAREVRNSNRLPRGLQERLTDRIQARHPDAEMEYNGVEVIVRDKTSGKEIESIKDVIELARVLNRPPRP
ncbi:MAG: hypothetical protein AB7G39_00900 [Alphaproteobacteria bacterium]